ncbi:uncharacterized protein PSFLO_00953 [Pseudozyma flocculosa]|uniref:F-box domain-containing protein n=1 Tax=Pseudozyma flocculosa TaxID=84751 RepID=A0A5C3ETT3_9BASI|nr:uncharacterized protein PSFLO_00953 [Pseudozyma flocculosa]
MLRTPSRGWLLACTLAGPMVLVARLGSGSSNHAPSAAAAAAVASAGLHTSSRSRQAGARGMLDELSDARQKLNTGRQLAVARPPSSSVPEQRKTQTQAELETGPSSSTVELAPRPPSLPLASCLRMAPVPAFELLAARAREQVHQAAARLTGWRALPPEVTAHIMTFFHDAANVRDARNAMLVNRELGDARNRRLFWANQWFRIGPDVGGWDDVEMAARRMRGVQAVNVRVDIRTTQLRAGRDGAPPMPRNIQAQLHHNHQVRELDIGRYTELVAQIVEAIFEGCDGQLRHLSFRLEDLVLLHEAHILAPQRLPNLVTVTVRLDGNRLAEEQQTSVVYDLLRDFIQAMRNRNGRAFNVILRYGPELRVDQADWIEEFWSMYLRPEMPGVHLFLEGGAEPDDRLVQFLRRNGHFHLIEGGNEGGAAVAAVAAVAAAAAMEPVRRPRASVVRGITFAGVALLIIAAPQYVPAMSLAVALGPMSWSDLMTAMSLDLAA